MNFEIFLSTYASNRLKAKYSCLHNVNYMGSNFQFLRDVYNEEVTLGNDTIKLKHIPDILQIYEYQRSVTSNIIDYIANPPMFTIDGTVGYNGAVIPFVSGKSRISVIHKGTVVTGCE